MIENIFTQRGLSKRSQLTVKGIIAIVSVFLAVLLPQLVHISLGASGGMKLLPMYLPVILAASLLGVKWGVALAILSPLTSFIVTLLAGNAMPAPVRLPYMIAELAVFALVSGLFSKKLSQNILWSFASVMAAFASGRIFFILLSLISGNGLVALEQVQSGLLGFILQITLIPAAIILINKFTAEK